MKPICVIIAGAPASGKSTLANEFVKEGFFELNRDFIRFNDLKLGTGWHDYNFNRENENKVHKIWQLKFDTFSSSRSNFVISDTLCRDKDRRRYANKLTKAGYDVIIVVLNPSLEILIERDKQRGNFSVGEKIIREKWEQLNENF